MLLPVDQADGVPVAGAMDPFGHRAANALVGNDRNAATLEITLTGPDTASGIWALEDWVVDTQWELDIRGAAFYEDDYVKRDGEWKILRTAYKRVLEELSPRAGRAGLQLTASYWGTGGRSSLPAPE